MNSDLKVKAISPTSEELTRILQAEHPQQIAEVLEKYGLHDLDFIQIKVPADSLGKFERYAYDGKIVITACPEEFGTVLIKEMHEEMFKF